jgi:plastocyanin
MTIEGISFGQAPTVGPGDSFSIVNRDSVRHTFTSPDGLWPEVAIGGGATAEFTVPADLAPGTYPFVCTVHPSMGGNLTVTG